MIASEADEIMRSIVDRFPEKAKDSKLLFQLHGALCALSCPYAVAAQSVASLMADPKAKFPTPQEIRGAVAKRERPNKFSDTETRARALLDKHGRDLLSIKARRAAEPCEWCEGDAVAHGVSPDDSILFHEHFKLAEYDDDPALSVAVDMAMCGEWGQKPTGDTYHAIRTRWTRSPSADDAEAIAIGNTRRFAQLLEAVTPKKPSRAGRGMSAVNDLKNEGTT